MQVEVDQVARKLVVGLRQIVKDMLAQSEARMEDPSVEAKGFLCEAMDQYADRVGGFATELAHAIGYVEPSADVISARWQAAAVLARAADQQVRYVVRRDPYTTMTAAEARKAILQGELDDCELIQDLLVAISTGRLLAEHDRIAEMLRPVPRQAYSAPSRLTVTLEGPQASGKTRVARWIITKVGGYLGLDPRVIEIGNDGRRFDVRSEVFLDHD